MKGGMWPNCLVAVRKAGIRCPPPAGSGVGIPDGEAAAGVLSTLYVLIYVCMIPFIGKLNVKFFCNVFFNILMTFFLTLLELSLFPQFGKHFEESSTPVSNQKMLRK